MRVLRGERVLIFIKKYSVLFTHVNSLPNNKIRFNYMVTVRLELLKQSFLATFSDTVGS